MSLVRPQAAEQRDAVVPLTPETVERVRQAMLNPQRREVAANSRHRRYTLPAPGDPQTRQRDALIVSMLAYSGLRPGELRALRWGDVGENVITSSAPRTRMARSSRPRQANAANQVRLLPALARDLREYKLAAGRPPEDSLILPGENGEPWTNTDWKRWREDRWTHACRAAGLDPIPRPHDLRHSFASLLLASGRQPIYVSRQLGPSVSVLLRTYAHLLDDEGLQVDADREIETARSRYVPAYVRKERIGGTA